MNPRLAAERRRRGAHPIRVGLIALAFVVVGVYLAFTKEIPFRSHYEIKATVPTASNVRTKVPVRTAGVDIGKVVAVEHPVPGKELAQLTLRIDDDGRPIHKDARIKIRPRLFLEGNYFIDLQPGTPSAGELEDGDTLPVRQGTSAVALSQVLTALQSDTRRNLQTLIDEYGRAVSGAGARGYRRSIPYWESAYRSSAQVQEATLGLEPHDLSDYIDGAGRFARGLDRSPVQLRSLITDLSIAAGAFARRRDALERAIAELPRTLRAARPALVALDDALPPLRRLTADLRPSIRASGPAIRAAVPFLRQTRGLVSRAELGGLVRDLRPTVPALARLGQRTIPLYEQLRTAASCENEVILPWSSDRLEDPNFQVTGPIYEQSVKGLPGLAAESRSGDANGQWFKILTSAGDHTIAFGDQRFAQAYFPLKGTNPQKPARMPPLRSDVPCETQERPDLRSRAGPAEAVVARGLPKTAAAARRYAEARQTAVRWLRRTVKREGLAGEVRVSDREITRAELLGESP